MTSDNINCSIKLKYNKNVKAVTAMFGIFIFFPWTFLNYFIIFYPLMNWYFLNKLSNVSLQLLQKWFLGLQCMWKENFRRPLINILLSQLPALKNKAYSSCLNGLSSTRDAANSATSRPSGSHENIEGGYKKLAGNLFFLSLSLCLSF